MKQLSNKEKAYFATKAADCNWYDMPDRLVKPVYWEMLTNKNDEPYIKVLAEDGATYYSARKSVYETFLKIAEYMEDDPEFVVTLQHFTSKKGFDCARIVLA